MSEECIEKTIDGIPLQLLLYHFPIQAPVAINLVDWSNTFLHSGYVVTEFTYFKTTSPFQHKYIRIIIRPLPGQQGPINPIVVRIERSIRGNGLLGWIGLYGSAYDTATVLDALPQSEDHRLRGLGWEVAAAPPLRDVLFLIRNVKKGLPRFCIAKTSCYAFSPAIFLSVDELYHHNAQYERDPPGWYLKESRLLGVFSAGSRRAQRVAENAVDDLRFFHRVYMVTSPPDKYQHSLVFFRILTLYLSCVHQSECYLIHEVVRQHVDRNSTRTANKRKATIDISERPPSKRIQFGNMEVDHDEDEL